jgi:hypothetical protein
MNFKHMNKDPVMQCIPLIVDELLSLEEERRGAHQRRLLRLQDGTTDLYGDEIWVDGPGDQIEAGYVRHANRLGSWLEAKAGHPYNHLRTFNRPNMHRKIFKHQHNVVAVQHTLSP